MSHVLDKFQFCPVCGSNHFEINNIKSKKCKDCGFSYYLNPSSATVALTLNSKEELLAVRRKKDPAKGACHEQSHSVPNKVEPQSPSGV